MMHPNFRIAIWSKYKVDDGLDKNKMKDVIEKRFSVLLPVDVIDMIVFRVSHGTGQFSKANSRLGVNDAPAFNRANSGSVNSNSNAKGAQENFLHL